MATGLIVQPYDPTDPAGPAPLEAPWVRSRHGQLGAGWRLRVEHVTTYEYTTPVRASYNELRLVPQTTARQTVLEARVHTTPNAPQFVYHDYWGTQVVAFNVDGAHDRLTVQGLALVETSPPPAPPDGEWEDVVAARPRFAEYLTASRFTEADEQLFEAAESLRRHSPRRTLAAVIDWVHDSLDYVAGVTSVNTTAVEAFAAGRGVCQDFAHLALAALRAVGIPARYVSGYLHPDADAALGVEGHGESHAWIEAWVGDWLGFDPTNDTPVGLRHVLVARARDYSDVPPIKGVFAGTADHDTTVSVTVTRTA